MNGIRNAINLSSNGCSSSSFGLDGHLIPFAIVNLGILPLVILLLHVVHIHSILLTDKMPEKYWGLEAPEMAHAFMTLSLRW